MSVCHGSVTSWWKKKIYNKIILVVRASAHVSDMSSYGACIGDLGSSLACVIPSLPLIEAKSDKKIAFASK